jgi:hypothetical protein
LNGISITLNFLKQAILVYNTMQIQFMYLHNIER